MSQDNNQNLEPSFPQQAPVAPDQMSVMIRATTQWQSGSLPPPSILREYEVAIPGAGNRLLTMAEQSQQADIDYDSRTLTIRERTLTIREHNERGNRIFAQCGQVFGFVSVVMYFAVLALTVWNNNTVIFSILFSAGAVAGIVKIVRSFQEKNQPNVKIGK